MGLGPSYKATPSSAQVASLWQKHHVLPLSPHLSVHHYSSSLHGQPWRRPSIASAIQQIHFINFNYIPTGNEWSENIKHLPCRSFTFFIQSIISDTQDHGFNHVRVVGRSRGRTALRRANTGVRPSSRRVWDGHPTARTRWRAARPRPHTRASPSLIWNPLRDLPGLRHSCSGSCFKEKNARSVAAARSGHFSRARLAYLPRRQHGEAASLSKINFY